LRCWRTNFLKKPFSNISSHKFIERDLSTVFDSFIDKHDGVMGSLITDRITWLAAECFTRVDKIYMSQGIEVRAPLALQGIRDSADSASLGVQKENLLGKKLLRQFYSDLLPSYIVGRKEKVGWRGPMERWHGNGLRGTFLDILPNEDGEVIDWKKIRFFVETCDGWPGKQIHLFLSLAVLKKKYNLRF